MSSIQSAARRAGETAIINMGLLYLGPHLSYQADWLNTSLATIRWIHRGAAVSFAIMTAFHVAVLRPSQSPFTWPLTAQCYGVIAALALAATLVLCIRPLRRPSFELFLRTHQFLAVGSLYAIGMHVRNSRDAVARFGAIGIAVCFVASGTGQVLQVLVRHCFFYHGLPRARIVQVCHVVRISVDTSVPITVRAGQYVNVYMPGVSFWSWLQSHPFTVAAVQRRGPGTTLELMVEPRRGWTSKLVSRARNVGLGDEPLSGQQLYIAFFSGPHGRTIDVDNYSVVVMVASGWGVIAQIPYLQHLISGYNNSTTKVRRIHLIWQLSAVDDGVPAEDLLNQALLEDTLDNGYILRISVHYCHGRLSPEERHPGQRVTFFEGVADWHNLINDELRQPLVLPEHQHKEVSNDLAPKPHVSAFVTERRRVVVMVSAAELIRRQVRDACKPHLSPQLRLVELDYQPN
ncbi:hypothetical protein LTR70_010372 [Exophiala xenobiotica]|uniref:FAD-binding FR-type domain-containing protein n=2 Tax=Trichomeriaceae TaxID=1233474 RepID=A0ABR0JUA9_9EURO|nr:hypothetical protein LTR24_010334 [Lithohypha guttulata]KAK5309339.1 hypothetical protein LTR70_010372 [Exophiala xenobiotica]